MTSHNSSRWELLPEPNAAAPNTPQIAVLRDCPDCGRRIGPLPADAINCPHLRGTR